MTAASKALWRSEEALAVVRRHLALAGGLFVINQAPGWRAAEDARASAEQVAESLRGRGFAVGEPLVEELEKAPVACVVARLAS